MASSRGRTPRWFSAGSPAPQRAERNTATVARTGVGRAARNLPGSARNRPVPAGCNTRVPRAAGNRQVRPAGQVVGRRSRRGVIRGRVIRDGSRCIGRGRAVIRGVGGGRQDGNRCRDNRRGRADHGGSEAEHRPAVTVVIATVITVVAVPAVVVAAGEGRGDRRKHERSRDKGSQRHASDSGHRVLLASWRGRLGPPKGHRTTKNATQPSRFILLQLPGPKRQPTRMSG